MAASIDFIRMVKYVRDQLTQSPLPLPASVRVDTITINQKLDLSSDALADLKKQLGL